MHARITLVLLLAALAGCGSTGTGLEANGRGTVPSLRVSFEAARPDLRPSDPHSGAAFELGFSRASASSSQNLPNGQSSTLGGETFNGPLQLQNKGEIQFIDALGRWRFFPQENTRFGIEALLGMSHGSLDYTTSAPGQRATDSVDNLGVTVGLGGIVRLREGTSVQLRHTWFAGGGFWTTTNARRFDISFVQALGRNLALRAGYASWQFDTDENTGSKLNAHVSGPTLGLEIGF